MRRIRQRIVRRFIAPRRGELFTRCGGGDPLEDATLYGGFYLAALSEAWSVRADAETAALCRQLLAGLFLNASVGEPGYLARGVEKDLKHWRGDPSVDQYTGWIYGLLRYAQVGPALPAEKQRIADLLDAVLRRLRRSGWQIMRLQGDGVTTFGRLADCRPTRAERLLAFLCAGADLTRKPEWQREYRSLWPPRAKVLHGFEKFDAWVLIQSAAALDVLRELDPRPQARLTIHRACREIADACLAQVGGWRDFRADPRPPARKLQDPPFMLRTVRIPVEAVTAVMLVGDGDQARKVMDDLRDMVRHFPVDACEYAPPLVALEWAWWRAARRGLLQ